MSEEPSGGGRGFFPSWGRGSIVRTTENLRSEIIAPMLAGLFAFLLGVLGLATMALDSLIIGPASWYAVIAAALVGTAAVLLIRIQREYRVAKWIDWVWSLALVVTFGLLIAWLAIGSGIIEGIWLNSRFVRDLMDLHPWFKAVLQPVFGLLWFAIFAISVRLLVEIVDPGWSRRFEQEAQFVGARALWPFGNPFPNKVYEARILELEAEIAKLYEQIESGSYTQTIEAHIYRHNGGKRKRVDTQMREIPIPPNRPDRLVDFFIDLMLGLAGLKEKQGAEKTRGAHEYGYSQRLWLELRDVLVNAGLAERLSGGGSEITEDGWSYIVQHVAQERGEDAVPGEYQHLLPDHSPTPPDSLEPSTGEHARGTEDSEVRGTDQEPDEVKQ